MQHNNILTDTARQIGDELCLSALWHKDACTWVTRQAEGASEQFISLKGDWYTGTSGISVFLAALYKQTGNAIYRHTARGALVQATGSADDFDRQGRYGLHTGVYGVPFAYLHCGRLLDDEALVARGLELADRYADNAEKTTETDIIGGLAGILKVLLLAYQISGEERFLVHSRQLGGKLLARATRHEQDNLLSWRTVEKQVQDLTGLAHGVSGIGAIFSELYAHDDNPEWKEAAEKAIAYENRSYSKEQNNWIDYRYLEKKEEWKPGSMMAWCHGAPGIGLTRVHLARNLQTDKYSNDLNTAVSSTKQHLQYTLQSKNGNFSLCHGMLGNAELLVYAAEVLEDDGLLQDARSIATGIVHIVRQNDLPWLSGFNNGKETAGFMLGNAGIGYQLLRTADPATFPGLLI
ncbi:lanthionine synthetase LanC family protein [Roseivirga sp. BDSF3-8]|uniref:lanthionine synthetase LanC family protein n=1 Tax=Roseivirga sp. BDSF3-8 TaxID=3241598 RepID=UPI0035323EEC